MEELESVLINLKSNKAPGQSGISYDFWKKSKTLTRKLLLEIINESMLEENAIDDWKKGIIYPINKTTRSDWNQELSLTRPIVLLETARKIWFKVLVNRLTDILTREQVLMNTNFAALKNESTLEPIKIIQAIIEDANNYNKEAWILLMDISKAYDSVNTTMLKMSLERIKLPNSFINLVMDISLNRSNKILVNNELTDSYHVEDGIDQGEVWSPILWRIFYDTLLSRLNEIKEEAGYNFHEERIINRENDEKEILDISINVTAFMDDTTLISSNKRQLERMINICHEFFKINDIKANVSKYEIIKINNKTEDLIIEGNKIEKVNNENGNRYLGIFFRHDNKRDIYKKKIISIIDSACNIFNWKKLNEKQIIAVWNIVIIPRIEYQMAAIVLKKAECNKLMTRINMIIKKRTGLVKSTSNFILYDKELLGMKHIYDLQIEMLCKNLLYQANGNDKLKLIFKIKIIQEQNKIWTSKCPGELSITSNRKNNWILDALKILNNENIKICNHDLIRNQENHRIKEGTIDLIDILDEKYINISASSRKIKNVMFIEDILEADGVTLLKWKHLIKEKNLNTQGRIPQWFKNVETKLLEDKKGTTRKIKNEYISITQKKKININYFDENEKTNKNQIITWSETDESPIFVEDKKKSFSKKYKRLGRHLVMTGKEPDLNNSPNLIGCEGCDRNVSKKKGNGECLIYIEKEISRKIEKRKEEDFIRPYETLNNILTKNIWLRNTINEEKKDTLYNKKIEMIDNTIKANEEFINIIKNSIFERKELDFGKDRFFLIIEVKKNKTKIDDKGKRKYYYNIIWKIRNDNVNNNNDELQIIAKHESFYDNEYKIILRSIILGLLIIAENSELILGINDRVKNLIYDFNNKCSNRRKIDSEYYLELLFIEDFLENNEIDMLDANEVTNKCLKEICKLSREFLDLKTFDDMRIDDFELIDEALIINEFNVIWNNRIISGGYRTWRKKITNAIWKNEILNSEKLDDLFVYNYKKEFDWITTLEFISNRTNFSNRQCCDKDTKERSYRIKNLLKELPTYTTLFKRNTNKIESSKCIRCRKYEEDWEHVWICENNVYSIDKIIQESPYKYEVLLEANNKYDDIKILRNHLCNFLTLIESPSLILIGKSRKWELLRGIFNNNFNYLSKIKEDQRVIKDLWNFIYDEIKNRLWIPRCEEVKRLEEKDGIRKWELRLSKQTLDSSIEGNVDIKNNKNGKTNDKSEKKEKNILKNRIGIVTLGKMIGKITDGLNIDRSWDTTTKLPFY
ncbi:hypothetical protein GLOIN_2v1824527 [Rhizophagus irregularis DAOM 181602=DAOM 197198]|uniref:Reverse transcriptase domain-containing protein n=2 Tax=Rhizophagus irregularis TaxID=588596 RepID=A0A015K5H1_RHIIW|nr:hypothetical protein RirG_047070 [Rhizophagus irregularis DAOM 197198w]GBC31832.1 hypothetical protein GLOIN_2v1824527 [Rhizophagus irregularis DAOM 181602=DAOM 197198]